MTLDYRIKFGLNLLTGHDSYLLQNDLNERTITHKLAEHYQKLFPRWNVDCEYNRNLGSEKKILIDAEALLSGMIGTLKENFHGANLAQNYESFSEEDIKNLEDQLQNPEFGYGEDGEIISLILELTNGKKIEKRIYPDIIIHKRGTLNNYIVIEAKKTSNTDKRLRLYDIIKLITLVKPYSLSYKQGVFIDLPVGADFPKLKYLNHKQNSFDSRVYEIIPKYI